MSANTLQFRRSERVRISMPVQVLVGGESDAVLECETLLVNLNGCGLRTAISIPVGSALRVRVGKDEIPGRVVTCIQVTGAHAFSVGVKFDKPYFWPVPNPPADWLTHPIPKPGEPGKSSSAAANASGASTGTSKSHDGPIPLVSFSDPAAISKSHEAVKQLNEAVAQAKTIAAKLDALAQALPQQLESRLKQKAEEAASAAQAAAVAALQKRLDAELKQRLAGVSASSIGQCTADLDAKVTELKQHADQLRQALSAHAETLKTRQAEAVVETVRVAEARLAKTADAAVQAFRTKLESAASAYAELQNIAPAEELLGKLSKAVRAADDSNRVMQAREVALKALHEDIATKAREMEQVSAKLTGILAECRQAADQAHQVERMKGEIDQKLQHVDQQRQALERVVTEGVAIIHREREVAVTSMASSKDTVREITEAVTSARGILAQLHSEAKGLHENLASESRKAVDEMLRSAASLQIAAVDLEQQAVDSFGQLIQSALNESLAKFELHVKAASQRFASALHAAAYHAFKPAVLDDSADVSGATESNNNLSGASEQLSVPSPLTTQEQ